MDTEVNEGNVCAEERSLNIEALPEVITADEVAALLRVNRKTVYAAFKAGEIPGKRLRGTIRFSRERVFAWLNEQGSSQRPRRVSR